ncbi:Conserved oligomeric Golgi complex subunit 8 [Dirofilaria immitis]|nr:Conserved oligomeric Golgi complex subunit 8 [Dirofilaria immitis]
MSYLLDNELRILSTTQLKQEKHNTAFQLLDVQQQISDLAYGNYRVYADTGNTAERCRQLFAQASDLVEEIEKGIESVRESMKLFDSKMMKLNKNSCMDICIRAGYYDMAYLLTNYGRVADKLIDARYQLLVELFNRFAGPIDLASSIQIVNNIRKIPCLSSTQMRVMILQYRDVYLEKRLSDIRSQPDFILRMVEVYRDCMYDTMVLYLAVFPENEISRRQIDVRIFCVFGNNSSRHSLLSSVDQRWDIWQAATPPNIGNEASIDIGSLTSKLMNFALSFGRMGMDFRPLIAEIIDEFVTKRFSLKVQNAANKLKHCKTIEIDGEIPDILFPSCNQDDRQPSAPSVLAFWDDLCIYGNTLIDALNELRSGLSPTQCVRFGTKFCHYFKMRGPRKSIHVHAFNRGKQQEKRCAIQIEELCNDCPNSIVTEKLMEEANHFINRYHKTVPIPINGNSEVSETHVPDCSSVSHEELLKLDDDAKIDMDDFAVDIDLLEKYSNKIKQLNLKDKVPKMLDLTDYDVIAVATLIDYMATDGHNKARITNSILGDMTEIACVLEMESLLKKIEEHANVNGYIARKKVIDIAVSKFLIITKMSSFNEIPLDIILRILDRCDLNINSEYDVAEAAISWIAAKPERVYFSYLVLHCIRIVNLTPDQRDHLLHLPILCRIMHK